MFSALLETDVMRWQ